MTALKMQLNNVGDINKNSLPFKTNFVYTLPSDWKEMKKKQQRSKHLLRVQRFMFQLTFKELHGAVWVTSQCQFYGWSVNPHPPSQFPVATKPTTVVVETTTTK